MNSFFVEKSDPEYGMKTFEVRRVPADWDHPSDKNNYFIPLHDGKSFHGRLKVWKASLSNWNLRLQPYKKSLPREKYIGARPRVEEHMQDWPGVERTHLMMYDVRESAGYPVSEPFERGEDLCHWLVKNQKSFEKKSRSYDEWMKIAQADDVEDDDWYDRLLLATTAMNAFYAGDQLRYKEVTQHLQRLIAVTKDLFE